MSNIQLRHASIFWIWSIDSFLLLADYHRQIYHILLRCGCLSVGLFSICSVFIFLIIIDNLLLSFSVSLIFRFIWIIIFVFLLLSLSLGLYFFDDRALLLLSMQYLIIYSIYLEYFISTCYHRNHEFRGQYFSISNSRLMIWDHKESSYDTHMVWDSLLDSSSLLTK